MTKFFFIILSVTVLSSCANNDNQKHVNPSNFNQPEKNMTSGTDFLDAYKLTIGKTFLYGNYDSFINDIGIPTKLTIIKKDYTINSKEDLDKIILTVKSPTIVTLCYPGIEMWYAYENSIVPSTIDFRKTKKSISYSETIFDNTYTLEQFEKQFPNSAKSPSNMPQSFFSIVTKEKGSDFKHYILKRKSKDDPNAEPMIEFTFDKDKLIFILFANF